MSVQKIIGRLIQFGIGKEVTRGTAVAVGFWIPVNDGMIDEKKTDIIDEQNNGVIEDAVGQTQIQRWAEGQIKAPIGDAHFPLLLNSILGTLSTGANPDGSGTVKDHTITVAQSAQHQSLTLFINDPSATGDAQDYKFALGVVDSLEISYALGAYLSYTATLKAQAGVQGASTPSTVAENRFTPAHVTFKMATNLAGLTGASATKIKALTLKISQNIEPNYVLGSKTPDDFLTKQFVIEGTIEAQWDDEATFKTATLANTAKAFRIDMKNTDVVIGTSANPEIQIDLAKAMFKEITRPMKLNDIITQTLQFKAYYSAADSKMVTIKCTNLTTSY